MGFWLRTQMIMGLAVRKRDHLARHLSNAIMSHLYLECVPHPQDARSNAEFQKHRKLKREELRSDIGRIKNSLLTSHAGGALSWALADAAHSCITLPFPRDLRLAQDLVEEFVALSQDPAFVTCGEGEPNLFINHRIHSRRLRNIFAGQASILEILDGAEPRIERLASASAATRLMAAQPD